MSLNTILSTGASGLSAAQTGMRIVSDNIANVSTPGYARKVANQVSVASQGMGAGVDVAGVRRIADSFLQAASLKAGADASKAGVRASILDAAQGLFGDPSGDNYFFGRLDEALSAFSGLGDDPSSGLLRSQAISRVQDFLNDASRIDRSLGDLRTQADSRLQASVAHANELIAQIDTLNNDIRKAKAGGGDASGSENIQSQLINELSGLMDLTVAERPGGGVTIRTGSGVQIAGDGPARLAYVATADATGYFTVTPKDAPEPLRASLSSGEIKGLIDLREKDLPGMADQIGSYVAKAAEEINRAHNASSAVPAPSILSGSDTGLDLPTLVGGFTGKTTVAVLNASGVVQKRVDIDFDAGTMSVDGAPGAAFSPASFLTSLNTALGGAGGASFTDRALTLQAAAPNGIAVSDDANAPASRAGRGFSQTFGLNDLIRTTGQATYDTGLKATDPAGFVAGGQVQLRLSDADGQRIRDVTVALPAGGTMQDVLNSLNANAGGVGLYGAFGLDSQGALSFTPRAGAAATVSVVADQSERGPGGPSLTELFGLGRAERGGRAATFSIDPAVLANPGRMAIAQLNLSAAVGTPALAAGDGRGAVAISQAGERTTRIGAAGDFGATTTTLSRYASQLGGRIANQAADADSQKKAAQAVQAEADARRQGVEGVNLDEELVSLTTYQQAFNASARIVQAASDLYDALLGMMR